MTVDPEVQRIIEIIDRKILALWEARKELEAEYELEPNNQINAIALHADINSSIRLPAGQKSRKMQLARFLEESGPMTRKEIILNCGFSEGTVSYCLNDRALFTRLSDGRWDVEPNRGKKAGAR